MNFRRLCFRGSRRSGTKLDLRRVANGAGFLREVADTLVRIEVRTRHFEVAILWFDEKQAVAQIAGRHAGFVSGMTRNECISRIYAHPFPWRVRRVMVLRKHLHVLLCVGGVDPAAVPAAGITPRALRNEICLFLQHALFFLGRKHHDIARAVECQVAAVLRGADGKFFRVAGVLRRARGFRQEASD